MRAWRALLWKESREELPKVLVGLGLCAMVVALRQNAEFNEEFARDFGMWITISILVCGGALGMGLVAKESSKGTLSFLLGKPLSAAEVLLPKYVVGAVALLVLVAGAWATVYLDLEGLASKGYSVYSGGGAWYPSVKRLAGGGRLCQHVVGLPYAGVDCLQRDIRQLDGGRPPAQGGGCGNFAADRLDSIGRQCAQVFPRAQAVLLL